MIHHYATAGAQGFPHRNRRSCKSIPTCAPNLGRAAPCVARPHLLTKAYHAAQWPATKIASAIPMLSMEY